MFKICSRCIMTDKGDDSISFDENGVCNYCNEALKRMQTEYFPNEQGKATLDALLSTIKKTCENKKYDCLMGISGGLDSSYLAYLGAKVWGLRILAIHIDDGFDSELAKENIEKLVKTCGFDLITIKPNEKEFNDLTLSYIKASVPNIAVPQDCVLISALYQFAIENNISYFLSGGNFSLECILQKGNTYCTEDIVNIKAIHKKFGKISIKSLPLMSWKDIRKTRKKLGVQTVRPLNYIDYNKERAIKELNEFCDFNYYEAKHYESIFTRFLQTYYLPKKYNVDKRTSHLSSLIITGQMTREKAIEIIKSPPIRQELLEADLRFIASKLDISQEELVRLVELPAKQHADYKTDCQFRLYQKISKIIHKRRLKRQK